MSLSTCEICGGHIPLGPDATNRCENCGAGVFPSVGENPLQREILVNAAARVRIAELESDLRDALSQSSELNGLLLGDLEKAEARIRELEDELKTWTDNGFQHDWAEENATLRAENARLREALNLAARHLEKVAELARYHAAFEEIERFALHKERIARAALEVRP